jgi:hypothetical protein
VDLDILPADPAWLTVELSNIEQALTTTGNAGERVLPLQRLALLDTPASVQRLVQLYLANPVQGEDWIFDSGLRDSSQIDVIIPLLEAALSDPAANPPTSLPELLAYLQTRKELGVVPAYPSDPAKQREWTDQWERRSEVRDKYFARVGALLSASIERRSGPPRATAIYQAWYYAGQQNATSPEERLRLQSNVLAVAGDLNHAQQVQFVAGAWQTMQHEKLLPLIRTLAMDGGALAAVYDNHEVFQLWCEGWAAECNAAILQDIVESNAQIDKNVILLMSEAEHPELDEMLETMLRDSAMARDSFSAQRTAAVILRSGSRNITSAVDSFLEQVAGKRGCDGDTQGELLGYLFRVAPEDGGKRLSGELQDKNDSCGIQVLRTLHSVRPSGGLIPIVTNALDSPNLGTAQWAALYVGEHGPASSKDALWRRLEALWSLWRGRSSELAGEMMNVVPDVRDETLMLEQALASALSHATNWKLSPTELQRLHSGCLTQPCRDIAEGKMSLGF